MYTIYVNDCPLILCDDTHQSEHEFKLRYPGSPKFFMQIVATLEGGKHKDGIELICDDVPAAWQDFQKHYKILEAAGGAVINGNSLLCIYRRESWDLPKGKIDEGETKSEAALREVTEETGLTQLRLGKQLPTTYHTYKTKKGKRILKPTYWYIMYSEQTKLVPQTEEDIEEARWFETAELQEILPKIYRSLQGIAQLADLEMRTNGAN